MSNQELHLCPNCFKPIDKDVTVCKQCKYSVLKKSKNKSALEPMTVVSGRYVIGRVLGSGGFGITYIAMDLLTDEICAIKEYFPVELVYRKDTEVIPISAQKKNYFDHGKERFLEEAKMLRKFKKNPQIVHVLNFFEWNSTAYLVMEYLNGVNFRTVINGKGGKVSFALAKEVFISTARALKDVHAQNVLHRDISAENIFITKDGLVKLIDFGSARQIVAEANQDLSVMLKPGTAPLEQYSSTGNQGPWTDIYSLASTFYQAVSGKQIPEAIDRQDHDTLTPLNEICNDVPKGWSEIIEKALRVLYSERYQSISEMMDDIKEITVKPSHPPSPSPKPLSPSPSTKVIPEDNPVKPKTPEGGFIQPPPNYIPKRAYIIIEKSKQASSGKKKIPLEDKKKYILGRSMQKSDIVIDMSSWVSREHCVVTYVSNENCFYIKDMSANGTYIKNGKKLINNRFEKVEADSVIFLGTTDTAIRVVIE